MSKMFQSLERNTWVLHVHGKIVEIEQVVPCYPSIDVGIVIGNPSLFQSLARTASAPVTVTPGAGSTYTERWLTEQDVIRKKPHSPQYISQQDLQVSKRIEQCEFRKP